MQTVTLEEAQARLPELIGSLVQEREILITTNGTTVARIAAAGSASEVPEPGAIQSMLDVPPINLGASLRPYPHPDDDILGEMLEGKFENWDRQR